MKANRSSSEVSVSLGAKKEFGDYKAVSALIVHLSAVTAVSGGRPNSLKAVC